jgi:prepilin-type N-terminal cleavage/methylation domain-containing protein
MKKSAFTLIELLVVIAIIAILAGIALPVFSRILEKGKLVNDGSNLRQIGIAITAYQNDNDSKMPPDAGGQTFIVSKQGTNQILLTYTGNSFAVWHSKFDSRPQNDGDSSPVSYSLNGKILSPTAASATPGSWTGDTGRIVVALSKLVEGAPNFTTTNGTVSWGTNVASTVQALPNKGQGMFQTTPSVLPTYYKNIPTLFADTHVEMVPVANFNCSAASNANWLEWDPINPNVPLTTP